MKMFECWYECLGEDDWKQIEAFDFEDAAERFFEGKAVHNCELTEAEVHVRCDGVTKRFHCYTEPSVTYNATEIHAAEKGGE